MDKVALIKQAVAKADRHQSKLTEGPLSIGGYTGKRIRHLLNNLGEFSTSLLEIGSHRGSTFISACYKNNLESAIAVDNFSEFRDDTVQNELIANNERYNDVHKSELIFEDCWTMRPLTPSKPIDLYLYDGPHGLEEQRRAVTHFLPAMAEEFIMCVDDAMWDDVKNGTNLGLEDANIRVLFNQLLYTGQMGDGDGYWNGFRVLLLRKNV